MKIHKGQRTVKRPSAYRHELGRVRDRFAPGAGTWRMIHYPDGKAYLEGLDGAIPIACDDPMHPENGAGELATYLEVREVSA